MKITKWKSISQWEPTTFNIDQIVDVFCHRANSLPEDVSEQNLRAYAEMILQNIGSKIAESEDEPVNIVPWIDNIYKKVRAEVRLIYLLGGLPFSGSEPPSIWLFKGDVYLAYHSSDPRSYSVEEIQLLILEYFDKDRRKWEQLKRTYKSDAVEKAAHQRERIPEDVRIAVWRRDGGKCVRCGSREKLEYDHIVPVSKGGSNTARNIELLCETCNRKKSNNIE
jgi:hypothetical protein